MEKFGTVNIRRIWDYENDAAITIAQSGDFPGNVVLFTEKDHQEWFGNLRLDLPAAYMRKIGEALIAAADEAKSLK